MQTVKVVSAMLRFKASHRIFMLQLQGNQGPEEEPAKRVSTSSNGTKQKVNVKLEEKVHGHQPKKPNKGNNFGFKSSSLFCSVCNVRCTSEIDMDSYLSGRRHVGMI